MFGNRVLLPVLGVSRLGITRITLTGVRTPTRCFGTRTSWLVNPAALQCTTLRGTQQSTALVTQNNHFSTATSRLAPDKNKNFREDVEKNLETMRDGKFDKKVKHPEKLQHFRSADRTADRERTTQDEPPIGVTALPHPIWDDEALHSVHITHMEPKSLIDKMAYSSVQLLRSAYDMLSGYNRRPHNEHLWLNRIIFLETVAGVPGMVAAMVRHLHSLRRMRRDHGWIHTLLEEAENERMHLMTAMQLKKPSFIFRWSVIATQGLFVGAFSIAYLLSPRFCHRFVGYLEEEAVITYSKLLKDIDEGLMQHWSTLAAPQIAIIYWQLMPEAVMKDVVLAIRADEAHHRVVNHTLGSMRRDDYNPYKPGE